VEHPAPARQGAQLLSPSERSLCCLRCQTFTAPRNKLYAWEKFAEQYE
jgi:hypothetical protein